LGKKVIIIIILAINGRSQTLKFFSGWYVKPVIITTTTEENIQFKYHLNILYW